MRIWDLAPQLLCRQHLLGEHRELHAIWNILTQSKQGYRNHPETKRWQGRLAALFERHEELVKEMQRRGYRHGSPLDQKLASGEWWQEEFIDTLKDQRRILKAKKCGCRVDN